MDRPLFPQGVEVTQAELNYGSAQSAFHTLRRFVALARAGRISGITVTESGATAGRVHVNVTGTGRGYTPNGELIELVASWPNVQMADSTASTVNLVCAVYREVATTARAHESDGTTRSARAERSAEVKVFTQAQYDALPVTDSSPADLTADVQDRILILAAVTAAGAGIAIPPGNIVQQASWTPILTATLSGTATVTGAQFVALDSAIVPGANVGRLRYTYVGQRLEFSSNSGSSYGAAVAVGGGGTFTLVDHLGNEVSVQVEATLLPGADQTDSFDIEDIYVDIGPMLSAEDQAHRAHVGSQLPTRANPHGLALADLAQLFYELPQTLILGGGLLAPPSTDQPRITTRQGTGGSQRTLLWETPGTGLASIRIYASTAPALEITHNALWRHTSADWAKDISGSVATIITLSTSTVQIQYQTSLGAWDAGSWTGQSFLMSDVSSGTNSVTLTGDVTATTGDVASSAVVTGPYDQASSDEPRLLLATPTNAASSSTYTPILDLPMFASFPWAGMPFHTQDRWRLYRHTTLGKLVFTSNAAWVAGAWQADDAAVRSVKLELSSVKAEGYVHNPAGPTWADLAGPGNWDEQEYDFFMSTVGSAYGTAGNVRSLGLAQTRVRVGELDFAYATASRHGGSGTHATTVNFAGTPTPATAALVHDILPVAWARVSWDGSGASGAGTLTVEDQVGFGRVEWVSVDQLRFTLNQGLVNNGGGASATSGSISVTPHVPPLGGSSTVPMVDQTSSTVFSLMATGAFAVGAAISQRYSIAVFGRTG